MSEPPTGRDLPGWFLNEAEHAGRENLDSDHVARYDDKEDSDAAAEVILLRELGLNERSIVIEIGAGTGQFVLAVAPHCERVIAVDVSPVMLNALRARVAQQPSRRIEVAQAGFLTYEHRKPAADFVYSRYALHHLPDFWKAVALRRVHGMLRPGGVLRLWDVVYNFDPAQVSDRIEAWCATGGETNGDDWSRAELEEHVRDEQSTFTWLLEPMIRRCGFLVEMAEHTSDGISARYILRRD